MTEGFHKRRNAPFSRRPLRGDAAVALWHNCGRRVKLHEYGTPPGFALLNLPSRHACGVLPHGSVTARAHFCPHSSRSARTVGVHYAMKLPRSSLGGEV